MRAELLISRDLGLGLELDQVVHLLQGDLERQCPSSKLLRLHLYAILKLNRLIKGGGLK